MTYKTRTGREYHKCRACNIKDFELKRNCPKCGKEMARGPVSKNNVQKELVRY